MSVVLFGIGVGFALAAVFFAVACWLDAGARRQCTRDGHDFVNFQGRGWVCERCCQTWLEARGPGETGIR